MLMLLVLQRHAILRKGTFGAQCKISNQSSSEEGPLILEVQLTRVKKADDGSDVIVNLKFDTQDQKELTAMADAVIGKSFLDFNVTIDQYPHSVKFEGENTANLFYKAKGNFSIGAITQTIWGGANTQFMATKGGFPSPIPAPDDETYLTYDWDFSNQEFRFGPKKGIAALTTAYKKSEVYQFWNDSKKYPDPNNNLWTTGITPKTIQNYWPKTRKDGDNVVKGGAKHGELIVVTLGFFSHGNLAQKPEAMAIPKYIVAAANSGQAMQCAEFKEDKTLKYKIPTTTYNGEEYFITNFTNAEFACSANVFTTYDISWNTWSVALTCTLLVVATLVIVPTKCFSLKAVIQKRRAAVDVGVAVAAET